MEEKVFDPDNYWEDRLHNIKGLEGVGFKKLGPSFNKWAYKVRKHVFSKQVSKLNVKFNDCNVLDIGSGTGFYIQSWSEFNVKKITGIDITQTSVENLKTIFPKHHFFLSDIGDVNFNDNNQYEVYDLISSMDVLFHIVDDNRFEQSIKNISSIIKPGGYFVYSDFYLHQDTIRGESQVSRSKEYLMDTFIKNGFELEIYKPFMYFVNKPVDTKNPFIKAYWFLLENGLYVLPFMGYLMGPLIYPFEIIAVDNCKESPTTEFTVFRKK